MIACMLVGSRNKGIIPNNNEYIRRVSYLKKVDFKPLIQCGFLSLIANDSDCKHSLDQRREDLDLREDKRREEDAAGLPIEKPEDGKLTPQCMVDLWNKAIVFFSRNGMKVKIRSIRELTRERREKCDARIKDCNLTEQLWKDVLNVIHTDGWLSGQTPSDQYPNWRASFDYVVRNQTNVNKILEQTSNQS